MSKTIHESLNLNHGGGDMGCFLEGKDVLCYLGIELLGKKHGATTK